MDVSEISIAAAAACVESPVWAVLREIYDKIRADDRGVVASYIPELTRTDPELFGICLVTADGHIYEVGACAHPFTIQSISKPLVYGLALEDWGEKEVLRRVGVEPSGDAFNAIVFDERGNRPFNPMVNAGAIATTALIKGETYDRRFTRMMEMFDAYAGRPLAIDEAVFASERATGHRNRAIAHLELNFGMIDERVDDHLDLYFKQCSILVTPRDLAVMAATLANDGVNPLTRGRAVTARYVRGLLSVMSSCGMYDYSGSWTFRVGLPAKSGVGGGIIAVLPGQFGLGVFSPRLDDYGNSVRGVRVCEEISARFGLHTFDVRPSAGTVLRRRYRGDQVPSKRRRAPGECEILARHGAGILVQELQGALNFTTVEQVLYALERELPAARFVILNGKRVPSIDASGRNLMVAARGLLTAHGSRLLFANFRADLQAALIGEAPPAWPPSAFFFDVDLAVEWCENRLLGEFRVETAREGGTVPLDRMDLALDFEPHELAELSSLVSVRSFAPGQAIFREGDEADALYMLGGGTASVQLRMNGDQRQKRLAAIGPGLTFGELALLDKGARTADVVATEPVVCYVLPVDRIDELTRRCPSAAVKLFKNVGRSLAGRLQLANREIRALEE